MTQVLQEPYQQIEDVDLEKKFLTCILKHPGLIKKAAFLVRPVHFYLPVHRDIYEAMMSLYQRDRQCNLDAVTDELARTHQLVEDPHQFKQAWKQRFESVVSLGDVLAIGTILKRKAKMRRLKDVSFEIAQLALMEEEYAVEQAEQLICAIMMDEDERANTQLVDAVDVYMADLEIRRANARIGITPGLSTGFMCLDPMFKLMPGELITIAALTGFGKSALMLNIALHLILNACKRVMVCSLEMGRNELVQRLLSIDTEIGQSLLSSGRTSDEEHEQTKACAAKLRQCDMVINDSSYGLEEIINKIKFEHSFKPLDLVIIDYVQLMEGVSKSNKNGVNRAQEVEQISRRLKQLAQTINVPILILSQVNREVEKRTSQEPELSDLSDSSGVAKNSDCVAFIYMERKEAKYRQESKAFNVRFKVAKNRAGPIGEENLVFAPRITRFKDEYIPRPKEDEDEQHGYV